MGVWWVARRSKQKIFENYRSSPIKRALLAIKSGVLKRMGMLVNVILTVQILTALGMIGLILIQHGKGADMGAAFGSGSSGSLFGASGSANFLSRRPPCWP